MTYGEIICEIDSMKSMIKEAEVQFRAGKITQEQYVEIASDAADAIEDYGRLINCTVDVNINYNIKRA